MAMKRHDELAPAAAAPAWTAYRQELTRFVAGRIPDKHNAEDIVHDVLIRAYSRREQLKDASKLRQWLFTITRNAITDHLRGRRPFHPMPDQLAEVLPDADETAWRQLALCLEPLTRRIDPKYGRAVALADLHGVRQETVAVTLGLSLSGAKSRIQRGRASLRDALLACCAKELDPDRCADRTDPDRQRGACGCTEPEAR